MSILATTTTILYSQRICNHLQIKYVLFFLKFSLSYLQSNISNGSTHFSMRTPSIICIYVKMFFLSALLSRYNGAFKLYLALRIKSCQSGLVRLLFQLIGWVCNCPVVYHLYYTNNPLQNLNHWSVSCMSHSRLFLG